jgi:hypothetical protein
MANIATNPWSFTNADQATTVAISSIVNNGGASALVTTGSAHGYAIGQNVSIQGAAVTGYNNGYKVLSIPSTTSYLVALLANQGSLANGGASGNSLSVAYPYKVRIEQISWASSTAATLLITDTNGNIVWTYTAAAVDQVYTYGKVFWVDGIVLNTLPATTTVLMTIN